VYDYITHIRYLVAIKETKAYNDSMNKEDLELTLQNTRAWIGFVDQKVNLLLVLQFGVLALILKPASDIITSQQSAWSGVSLLVLVFAVCTYAYSIFKLILAIKPRIKSEQKGSLIFFGSIAALSIKEYTRAVSKRTKKEYYNDLAAQINVTSKISNVKHVNYTDSLILFIASILLLGILILNVQFWNV